MSVNHFILNSSEVNEIGDMAAKLAIQNFDHRYATIVLFNSLFGVELFLHLFNYNIIVNRETFNSELIKMAQQYVIFGSDIFDLEHSLHKLREIELKNTGKFIIVCQSQEAFNCDEKKIMTYFWDYKIINVVFIKYGGTQPIGFTYFPISEGDCNNVNPIKLKLTNVNQYSTPEYGNMFEKKLKKMDLCPLFVSTFIQPPYMNILNGTPIGADGDLLRIIAYGLNSSLVMMTPHRGDGWGFRDENGTWMGSLGDIYDDLANISMTSAAVTISRFSTFQISRPYASVHVVWVTHPGTLQNEALKLLYPLRKDARIALIVSFVIVILCGFFIKSDKWLSISTDTKIIFHYKSIVFYSWRIFTGQALVKLPSKSFLLQMTVLWIYYCFIIRTAYQVYLISSLKGTFYEDHVETIEDAIQLKYEFGGGVALRDYFINYPVIYKNWISMDTDEIIPTALNISKGKRFVVAMNWHTAQILIKKHKINLYILQQKIISSPGVIFFKKYSPLVESINVILNRLVATGFSTKIYNEYTSIKTATKNVETEALKLKHLAACYVVLVIGWLLSLIFFSLEIYFGKIYQHPSCLP